MSRDYYSLEDNQRLVEDIPVKLSTISSSWNSQWESPSKRKFLIFKLVTTAIALCILAATSLTTLAQVIYPTSCLQDLFQDWTASVNSYLTTSDTPRNILIAIASFLIDFNVLALSIRWIFYADTLRMYLTVFAFYGFRGICQKLFYLEYPIGYIFANPGFPSLVVPYAPTNDFFFSGHVGICTLCFLEFSRDKARFLRIVAFVSIPFEFITLLFTRKHHFIDMAVGIITAHYFYRLGIWLEDLWKEYRKHAELQERKEL